MQPEPNGKAILMPEAARYLVTSCRCDSFPQALSQANITSRYGPSMPRSLVLTACLLALAAAISTWFWWPRDIAPPKSGDTGSYGSTTTGAPESGSTVDTGVTRIPLGADRTSSEATGTTAQRFLQVQLRGLEAVAPWTAPLQIELSNRIYGEHNDSAQVQRDGRCALPLPTWWQPGMPVKLRIDASCTGYRPLNHRASGALALEEPLTIEVQPVAALSGRVLDSRGQPIAHARITAFAMQAGQPMGEPVGATGTDEHGQYLLYAPPAISLLIVATAMQPNLMAWRSADGISDNRHLRAELLPATLPVQLDLANPDIERNFMLADAAIIHGTVRWPDQLPVANATVRFGSSEGIKLKISSASELRWQADGTVTATGTAAVDANGHYSVPARPGATTPLTVVSIASCPIIGELPTHQVVAPTEHTITLPFPVTLRAVHQAQLVPYASILLHGMPPLRAQTDGTCTVLISGEAMVRAERGALRSPWQSISSSNRQQTIDFVMSNELVALHIEFEADVPVRHVMLDWRCEDGRRRTESLQRADDKAPFEILLEPGNYDLRITAAGDDGDGSYLVPITRKLRLARADATAAMQLLLPASYGGTFRLQVLDENSRFVGGTCTIIGPDRKSRTAPMTGGGKPGVFPAAAVRCEDILSAGPYELEIDLGAAGVHKSYVIIKERQTAEVVLRL
jgi:hypothetical protein